MKYPIPYVPKYRLQPKRTLNVASAWKGLPEILPSLMHDFQVGPTLAVEFGVETGYSSVALAEHFLRVIGVDTFTGLGHDSDPGFYEQVRESVQDIGNLTLVQSNWQDFAKEYEENVNAAIDLIHVDIDHGYDETYEAGEWAVKHAPVCLFHDTLSFTDIPTAAGIRACGDLAQKYGLTFHNFEESHGLGILSRKEKR